MDSDERHRIYALNAALEWLFAHVVSQASNPAAAVKDFEGHMKLQEKTLSDFAEKKLLEGDADWFSNLSEGAHVFKEMSEDLVDMLSS
jgi:hypothetical protein